MSESKEVQQSEVKPLVVKTAQEELIALELEIKRTEFESAKMRLALDTKALAQYREEEHTFKRNLEIRIAGIHANKETTEAIQKQCRHKTGGTGKPGFFRGDGKHGYCVNDQTLPWGEVYRLCLRCQKEWRHPDWIVKRAVANHQPVTMTKAEYTQILDEYMEALSWDVELNIPCEASLFKVPALDRINVQEHLVA